jgi:hypothetical protein
VWAVGSPAVAARTVATTRATGPLTGVITGVVAPIAAGEERPEAVKRHAQEPGDVHLGAAHLGRDLGLCETSVETQTDHLPFPFRQCRHRMTQRLHVVHVVEALIQGPDRGLQRSGRHVIADAGVQRQGTLALGGAQRLDNLVLVTRDVVRQFGGRRGAAVTVCQLFGRRAQLEVQLLDPTGGSQHPAVVPEVAFDRPRDGRKCECPQRHTSLGIKPVDRVRERQVRDLMQVLVRHTGTAEPPRQLSSQSKMTLYDPVAQVRCAAARPVLGTRLRPRLRQLLEGRLARRRRSTGAARPGIRGS